MNTRHTRETTTRTNRPLVGLPSPEGRRAGRLLLSSGALTSLGLLLAACSAEPSQEAAASTASAVDGPGAPGQLPPLLGWDAAWDDTGLNDTGGGGPLATTWGPNRLDLFLRNGSTLTQKYWTGAGWSPAAAGGWPLAVKDGLASDPGGMAWGGGNIDLVWRDAHNALDHFFWDSYAGTWTEENLGGTINGRPSLVVASDGSRGDIFARVGTAVWHRGWAGVYNAWSAWEPLALSVVGDPVAVSDAPGRIEIFYRGSNGAIDWASWDGNASGGAHAGSLRSAAWTQRASLGGVVEGDPSVATSGSGVIEVVAVGLDSSVYTDTTTTLGQAWSGWYALNGCARSTQVALTSWGAGRQDLFTTSTDTGTVLHDAYRAGAAATPGLTPICCSHEAKSLSAVSDGTSITGTLVNKDNTEVTVTATNQASASDSHSVVVSGSGTLTYTIPGLQPSTSYLLAARAGGSQGSCGPTSSGTISTLPGELTFSLNGTMNADYSSSVGTISYYATVHVMDTGEVTWSVVMTHSGSYVWSYDLQVPLPGVTTTELELKGEIANSSVLGKASTTPGTLPISSAAGMAAVRAAYRGLASPGVTLSGTISATAKDPSSGGTGGSTCAGGGARTETPVCCNVAGTFVNAPLADVCSDKEAIADANGQGMLYEGDDCSVGACKSLH